MPERADDPQLEALRAFTFLSSLRPDWSGALVLACGLSAGGEQFSIAANIAGAGFLAIDSNPEFRRAAMRSGACDFLVNSVDEALRILKNEIRKRKPVSVALAIDEAAALAELIDRGVQPELFAAFGESVEAAAEAVRRFQEFGAIVAGFRNAGIGLDADAKLDQTLTQRGLTLASFVLPDAEKLRAKDAELLQLVSRDDPRRRWFAAAPRFFHRERPYRRLAYLTSAERSQVGG